VVESLIGGLFMSIRPYLPYTASTALAGVKLGGAAFGPAHTVKGGSALSFATAAILLIAVAALISLVAPAPPCGTTSRNDDHAPET
jgi:hypothetical protein